MMNGLKKQVAVPPLVSKLNPFSRRKFLGFAGMATGLVAVLAACNNDDDVASEVNLGSGDIGILNYAYALEQLEAAFYIKVIASPYSGISADETARLTEIRDHEIAHREFFKNALGAQAITGLTVDFSSINFLQGIVCWLLPRHLKTLVFPHTMVRAGCSPVPTILSWQERSYQ
jgi:hypothetical protein